MACPTCGHSMAALEQQPSSMTWLCDRCGTVCRDYKSRAAPDVYVPRLVELCRKFASPSPWGMGSLERQAWNELGIKDAITAPEDDTDPDDTPNPLE